LTEGKILRLRSGSEVESRASDVIEGVARNHMVNKVVVLPDSHHKRTMEFPSSTAVAVKDAIVPHLTSNSVNCGMALVRTNLTSKELGERELDRFFKLVRESFPSDSLKRSITVPEVFQAITRGAQWALERFELEPQQFAHVAQGVQPRDNAIDINVEALRTERHDLIESSCYNFGEIGKSNHFIELQMVEEVIDTRIAALFKLERGQLVIMYHGGGGAYCGSIGNLFVPRKKGTWWEKFYTRPRQKIAFHVLNATSMTQLRKRINYYFFNRQFVHIPADEEEGKRLLRYDRFAMNYGYAYRIAALAMIQRALKEVAKSSEVSLIYDLPHNLIKQEMINGQTVYVHRHNASPCYPANLLTHHPTFRWTGQPVLLPGTNRTASFLCVAAEGADQSLFSVDHGAGHTVKRYILSGKSKPVSGLTRRYSYETDQVESRSHYDDAGVRAVLDPLIAYRIVRPTVKLRPIASLT